MTGLWNILAARHVARRFREWGLPPQLRYPVASVEFIASALLLWPTSRGLGMLLATAILLASISFCLYKGIYQRLLLSIPMLLAVLLYYSTSF